MDGLFDHRRYLIPFRSSLLPAIFTDTLVIGAGVAGLRAAIAAAEHGEVIVLSKGDLRSTNTAWAQGGIASAVSPKDTIESHIEDTLSAGAGLCDVDAVRTIVGAGPRHMTELLSWGMKLDRNPQGEIMLGREGGHAASRIVHSNGDATGAELQRVLEHKARAAAGVRIFEKCFSLD
ncbi:MAG: L-aspartate oxidase, partial [Planctomycetota bacterium]